MAFVALLAIFALLFLNEMLQRGGAMTLPRRSDPVLWMAIPVLLCLLMFALPVIVHRERFELLHAALLSGYVACFMVGSTLHRFLVEVRQPVVASGSSPNRTALWLCLSLGVVGLIAIAADQVAVTGLSLLRRLEPSSLEAIRASRNAASVSGIVGPYYRLESLVAFIIFFMAGVLMWGFGPRTPDRLRRVYIFTAVVVLGYLLLSTIYITGGRIQLVLLTLMLLAAACLDPRAAFLSSVRRLASGARWLILGAIGIALVGAAVLYSTVYLQARSAKVDSLLVMRIAHRADVAPWLNRLAGESPQLASAIFQYSYFTTPLATFAYYTDLPAGQLPGPHLGQYNFWGVADRVLRRIDMAEKENPSIATDAPLNLRGYGGNIWRTALIDYVIDFGFLGTALFLVALGHLSRMAAWQAWRTGRLTWIALGSTMLTIAAFTPLHALFNRSPFITSTIFWSLIVIGLGAVSRAFVIKPARLSAAALRVPR